MSTATRTSHRQRQAGELHVGEVVKAVDKGGVITFNCGPDPVTITMTATAKGREHEPGSCSTAADKSRLSGGGKRRILYMNTCDQGQIWTTGDCQNQNPPQLERAEPDLRRRQLDRPQTPPAAAAAPSTPRRRLQGGQLAVRRQPLLRSAPT